MNFLEETLKIFQNHVTSPTREKELRRLFRVVGEESSISQAPLHISVCEILKAKLPEHETESKLKALIGMTIEASPKDENQGLKALAAALREELGMAPSQVDHEAEEKAMLAKAYPSLVGPESPEYDPLEGLSLGEREICENFYGSGGTRSFGFQDGYSPESPDPEAEAEALRLYPSINKS
jgi:hypothetical protein